MRVIKFKRLFLVAAVLLFSAVAQARSEADETSWWQAGSPKEGGAVAVLRSPGDERQYRYLQLDNKMKVLLVSDAKAEKSAASLNVYVGSFQNPVEREGLAHFLEHMLFLGTEKYPEAGEYQAYISEHGGQHNAYTSLEQTNYFFNVDSAYLLDTLDRFAQFFVAPRFDAKYVDRERHAVDSEYQLKIKDDSRREWDVMSELLNPKHPLAKFSVGNLETLVNDDERPIRPDLLAFYQRFYSANLMTLVVLGNESLDQLEAAVKTRFSGVVNHNTRVEASGEPLFAGALPLQVAITPEKEKRELSLLFPLPSVKQYWRQGPLLFLGHLLGGESEGSFLAAMKARGLVESLTAGPAFDSREGGAFAISIGLTPQGVAARKEVLDVFYQWLTLTTEQGIEAWRYDELTELQHSAFRFLEKSSASSYVQALSVALHDYPPQEVLRGHFLYDDFDAALIKKFAGYLRPDNALVTWVAPELVVGDTVSARYSAPYQRLAANTGTTSSSVAGDLSLPGANVFLPAAFPLSGKDGEPAKPLRLPVKGTETSADLWYYADNQFASPRASFSARLATPLVSSCLEQAQAELYTALVEDQLDAGLYAARIAGLNYSLSRWDNGIAISIAGYADKQAVLLDRVLDVMATPDWDATRFQRVSEQLIREGRNSLKQWPIRQVFAELDPLLRGNCRAIDMAEQLEAVSIGDMQSFAGHLFNKGHALFYAGGVLSGETAQGMAANTLSRLQLGRDGDVKLDYSILKLQPAKETPLRQIPVEHSDSSAVLYVQGDDDSLRERAHVALLDGMLSAPFYSDMRTEKKLGYVVGSGLAHRQRVPGLMFYIQSPVASAEALRAEMTDFIADFVKVLEAMSEEELARYQRSALVNIEEKPKSLAELNARYWESLSLGFEGFDFRPLLAEQVRAVSRASLFDAYQRLLGQSSRALWVTTLDDSTKKAIAEGVDYEKLKANSEGTYRYAQ
ncbi:MAG: insulinase family protein [Gammaproteobacteria bacterium]|nr:insulinase family protein [Gammaproteobacteria bacterium]MBQ0838653.1 insulinase family protein [Gammaproteobacteria bacterium]